MWYLHVQVWSEDLLSQDLDPVAQIRPDELAPWKHWSHCNVLLWEKAVRGTERHTLNHTAARYVSVRKQMALKEGTGRQDAIAAGPSVPLKGKLLLSVLSPALLSQMK